MSYKKLKNFQPIFDRPDFSYISDLTKIEEIANIILFYISNPDGKEASYIKLIEEFIKNLTSFYDSIAGYNVPNIKKGYLIVLDELQRCIRLFSGSESERRDISKRYLKKFTKTFLYGLSKLYDGIKAAFDPDIISSTKIDRNQFVRYILNSVEGLGKKFLFNGTGRHAFLNKINLLNMQELIATSRLLTKPSTNQIRMVNGWIDLGLGHTPVRILAKRKYFGKQRICFLYRLNEHNDYEAQLQISPDQVAC